MFKVVLISDTHNRQGSIYTLKSTDSKDDIKVHYNISGGVFLPAEADMIIHAGDTTMLGSEGEVNAFLTWFSSLPYKYKIFIAGNHDWLFDIQRGIAQDMLLRFPDIIYLENDFVEIDMDNGQKLKIWGSPITPWFNSWAFNRARGEQINRYWAHIPEDVDILVTHGPPFGVLDVVESGENKGCEQLKERILQIRPKLHVFGHIHEDAGYEFIDGVHYVNASAVNRRVQLMHRPMIFQIDENKEFIKIENVIPE